MTEATIREKTRDKLRSNIWRVIHPVVKDLGYDEAFSKLNEIIELFDKHIKTSNAEAYKQGRIDEAKTCEKTKQHDYGKIKAEAYRHGFEEGVKSVQV